MRRALGRLEGSPHRPVGVMESRASRPLRNAEELGDFGRRQPEIVAKDEDRSLIRRQPPETTIQLVPISDGEQLVASDRAVGRKDLEDGGPALRFASFRVAGVDEQAMQPGVEPIRIAEPRQLAPGDHQRLLNGVLGSSDVSEDPLGDREHSVGRRPREDRECFAIPGLRLFDEVPIHRLSIPERTNDGALHGG